MKTLLRTITTTALLGFLTPILVLAQNPSLPHQFFGSVNFTNGAAPNGLAVEARINGAVVGNSVTANGKYGHNPNLLFALDNQGVHAGKTVEFYVDGIKANETAVFVNGNSSQVNLTIVSSLPTTPTGGGGGGGTSGGGGGSTSGGGGGGGVTISSTSVSPLSAAAQKVDANKDNKIDVLDFNTLMVNWGSTSVGNAADFNGDGKVDVFDFNLLMVNWTL